MTADRWARIERIYHAALERPVRDRDAFIRKEAGEDAELVAEIEALLAYDERPAAFMERSAIELAARAIAAGQERQAGVLTGAIGSYQILRPLGAGGMGDVYLARDSRLARSVALKTIRPDLARPEWIAAFRQEALAASALNHPNIVTIYEIGEHDGIEFIATEHVEGTTLRDRLKSGPMPAAELVDVALQIAEGLAAAHEAGVVHRDIKPDNVMLRADGLVKILDFGIATRTGPDRARDADTGHGGVIGTAGYMSPEQVLGLPVDTRTDLWSLGIVLVEMATGDVPTSTATTDSDGTIRSLGPVAFDELRLRLPSGLEPIVRRALSWEPRNRYTTAREMARDLRALRRALEAQSHGDNAAGIAAERELSGSRSVLWRTGAVAAALIATTLGLLTIAARVQEEPAITSLGVMPLEHASDIPDAEFLADGIAASLRSRVGQVSSIRQAAPSEAARYKRLGVAPARAGTEMGVAAILTGTLERRDDTVVVRLDLLRSVDGSTLWGRTFIRPVGDVLTLQTEIARDLIGALGVPSQRDAPPGAGETRNPAAYQLYARGRYHVQRRTPDDLRKGLQYLQQAVSADPAYARAYAKISEGYILLAMASDAPPRESFPRARTAAERALSIDPGLSEARVSMGIIKFWFDWDWSGAEAEFRRALEADRPDPAAHIFYGHLLSNLGDHAGALQEMRRALDYEPHAPLPNALLGQCLYYQGRLDESLAQLRKTLELDPDFWLTHNMMGRIYERKRMYQEALDAFDKATGLGGSLVTRASAAYTLAASGRRDEARVILNQLKSRASQTYVPPSNLALVHLGLGEHDEALDWLEKAYEARDMLLTFLIVEPRWTDLTGHPRFAPLLKKIGLEP